MMRIARALRRFRRREEGSSTVEFVILFPFFMTILFSSVEAGMLMVRGVMLERGVDIATRSLRLGSSASPEFAELKQRICDATVVVPDCINSIQIEMTPVSTATWAGLTGEPRCIDREQAINPLSKPDFYNSGVNNDLMMVRVCALYRPFFPGAGLGAQLKLEGGEYAMVASTAFVNEPLNSGSGN